MNSNIKKRKLGIVAKSWDITSLADLCSPPQNGLYRSGMIYGRGHRMVHMQSLFAHRIISGQDMQRVDVTTEELNKFGLAPGDLLFGRRSLALDGVGKASIVGELDEPITFESSILRLRTDPKRLNPYFALAFLDSSIGRKQMLAFARQATISGITGGDLKAYLVPIPSLQEQRKIADIHSTWDKALETLDALIAAKILQKQALMQQLLTGKTRVKGAKGKWKKIHMGDVLERVFRPIDWHADLPLSLISLRRRCGGLFRRPDVKGSEYKTQDLHEIRAGDFLISKRQVVHGAWGYVTQEFEGGHVSKEYAILDNRAPDKLHMPFFAWLAQTRRLIRLARVSSTGVHIEKLIFDPVVFLRESILIPADLAEQEQIAAILDTADQELTLLRTQRSSIDQQKRGLMQRLLTGKIRVKTS